MKTVRIAIIGCGGIADMHAKAIHDTPNAELTACYSRSSESANRFAQRYGIEAFTSYEALLASPDVDAVALCTPSGLHTAQAIQAIQAGKHVLVEKPMSLTLREADELIATVDSGNVVVGVISQYRTSPAVEEIKRAIDAGALGRLTSGSLQMKYWRSAAYYASGAWRGTWALDGGGALMNQGIHGVDIFRYLMGAPVSLTAYARTLTHDIEVEDMAVAILEFEGGALGTIEGSTTCNPGYPRRIEICGDKGSVVLEEDSILKWDVDMPCNLPVGNQAMNVGASDPLAISYAGHTRHFTNFVNAILHGEKLLQDVRGGRLPLEIILSIYRSSQQKQTIDMKEVQR